jgi:hypothetical protein
VHQRCPPGHDRRQPSHRPRSWSANLRAPRQTGSAGGSSPTSPISSPTIRARRGGGLRTMPASRQASVVVRQSLRYRTVCSGRCPSPSDLPKPPSLPGGSASESRIHLDTSFLTLSNPGASHPLRSTDLSLLCQTSRLAAGTGRKPRTDKGGRKIENEGGDIFHP